MKVISPSGRTGAAYGRLVFLMGFLFLVPLSVLLFAPSEGRYAPAFLIPAAASFVLGPLLSLMGPEEDRPASYWESLMEKGSGPVLFIWGYAFVLGALPFVIGHQLAPVTALFESVSGWTTTGLTVSDVTVMPWIFLFYRSFMQYCGGLGFVIMIIIATRGKQSLSIYSAEGHLDAFRPSLRETARVILALYLGWLAGGILLYVLSGMPAAEAVCHTMSALSTAGFSTRPDSLAAYDSVAVELVTILLMLIGASNFAVVLKLVRGRFRQVFRESEFRFMLWIVLLFSLLSGAELFLSGRGGILRSFLDALFAVVTTFSTTGYTLENYSMWPAASLGLLFVLMIIGGCSGSTAGGIKMVRAYLLGRIGILNLHRSIEPARWAPAEFYIRQQEIVPIDERVKERLLGFLTLYLSVLIAGSVLLSLSAGCDLPTAVFEFTSALGTVGLSNGLTSPDLPAAALFIEMVGMVLGRLEIIVVIIGISTLIRRSWNLRYRLQDRMRKR